MKNYAIWLMPLLLTACGSEPKPNELSEKTEVVKQVSESSQTDKQLEANLKAHIEFLADDSLKGRNTGSKEYEIAARYVASHFNRYGLTPAGDNNTWYQSVPFVRSQLKMDSVGFGWSKDGEQQQLAFPEEFMVAANPNSKADKLSAELVFVGYGIDAPSLKHQDYDGVNVEGKIVVMLSGKPASFPSEVGAHVSSGKQKNRYAAERGAVGIISLHTPERDKVRAYEKSLPFVGHPSFHWLDADGVAAGTQPSLQMGAYLSKPAGIKLFKAAGASLEAIFEQTAKDITPAGFDMDLTITMQRYSQHEKVNSSNVVAIVEGSDPQLKHEYVVYSAHLDHLGEGGMVKGDDVINNGALDNASGIAVMLETARQFAQKTKPKRSILFVAVTGEEKGLLGSEYFAKNPTVAQDSMIANINLDMPLILYPFADVIAFGSEHSTMAKPVARAAESLGLSLSPDPMPEQNLFVRSDHYSFVKEGVPSIFLVPGFTSKDPEIDGAKVFQEFFHQHYHQPTDDANLAIDYAAGATFAKVNYQIGQEIANDKAKPRWNEQDFFGDTFGNQ